MAACGLMETRPESRRRQKRAATNHIEDVDEDSETGLPKSRRPFQLEIISPGSEEDESKESEKTVKYELITEDLEKLDIYKRFMEYALALKARMAEINQSYNTDYKIQVGIHIGPLVAGVIGKSKVGT